MAKKSKNRRLQRKKGKKATTKMGKNTKITKKLAHQPHPPAQYPPEHEDGKSKNSENTGPIVPTNTTQREELPAIMNEPATELLPVSGEPVQEPPNSENDEINTETLKDTISALRKEGINLSYKIVRAEHHRRFAHECGENKVIPTGLDYTKVNIQVMQSPDDDDNQRFTEEIEHIQALASQLTLATMEHYYDQLVLKLQVKLGTTTEKLSYYRQKLKNLVAKEEWAKKQHAHEELLDSLTNKLDKFSERLDIRRAKKLEKLLNPGAKPKLPRKNHIERTHKGTNKGKLPSKKREEKKPSLLSGYRDDRTEDRSAQRHNTYQTKDRKERLSRAAPNITTPSIQPPAQITPIHPSPHHTSQTPAWPHPLIKSQTPP